MVIAAVSSETVLRRLQPDATATLRRGQIFAVVRRVPETDKEAPIVSSTFTASCWQRRRSGRSHRRRSDRRRDRIGYRQVSEHFRFGCGGRRLRCRATVDCRRVFVVDQWRDGTREPMHCSRFEKFLLDNAVVVSAGRRSSQRGCAGGYGNRWCRRREFVRCVPDCGRRRSHFDGNDDCRWSASERRCYDAPRRVDGLGDQSSRSQAGTASAAAASATADALQEADAEHCGRVAVVAGGVTVQRRAGNHRQVRRLSATTTFHGPRRRRDFDDDDDDGDSACKGV